MVQAVLFDLDDTLLWDEKSIQEAFEATCRHAQTQYDIDPKRLEEAVRAQARPLYQTYDTYAFAQSIGISPFEALWGNFHDEGPDFRQLRAIVPGYRKKTWTKGLEAVGIQDEVLGKELAGMFPAERRRHVYMMEGAYPVLDTLKETYNLLLLTNGSPDLQRTKLSLSPDLPPYFDHIIISGDFGAGKPDSAIFRHALDHLAVKPEEAVMVGDNPMTDILGAQRIGMPSIWLNQKGVARPREVDRTHEIRDLQELPAVIHTL